MSPDHRKVLESQNAIKRLSPSAQRKLIAAKDELTRLKNQHGVAARLRINPRLARVRGKYFRVPVSVIELSTWMLEHVSEEEVVATIRHEYAHALTPAHLPAHGTTWRRIADELGVPRERNATNPPRWVAVCLAHGVLGGWQRKPSCPRICNLCGHQVEYQQVR